MIKFIFFSLDQIYRLKYCTEIQHMQIFQMCTEDILAVCRDLKPRYKAAHLSAELEFD